MSLITDTVQRYCRMHKLAYLPLTPAAQQAVQQDPAAQGGQPPQDPAMMQEQPPMPPQGQPPQGDPNMQGGMPPMPPEQGGQQMPPQGAQPPQIQVIPGPNGEQVDAETGFIVLDLQQGIEQDPITGIMLNKMTGEFATPDGQPLDPQTAMQILTQAYQQAQQGGQQMAPQGDPNMQGGQPAPMPPQDPAMMQGQPPMPPQGQPMMQQQANADPAMMQEQPSMPPQGQFDANAGMQIDPNTGMPIDPATGGLIDVTTGQIIDPNSGAAIPPAIPQSAPMFSDDPEIQAFVKDTQRALQTNEKNSRRIAQDLNGLRTDVQGLRRELEKVNDNADTTQARLDNLLAVAEQAIGQKGMIEPIQGV